MPNRSKLRLLLVALGASALWLLGSGPSSHPQAVASLTRFLELNLAGELASPAARALLHGEALLHWTAPSIGPIQGAPDRLIERSEGSVVARVSATSPRGEVKDFYFYLERVDGDWKVATLRTLGSLGPLQLLRENPAALAEDPDRDYMAKNVELALRSDAALRAWHASERAALQRIAARVLADAAPGHRVEERGVNETPIGRELRTLGVASAQRLPSGVRFTLGGIQDDSVGFLYLESGTPPPISPDAFIWVEPLGDGWYLFRTT